MLGTFADHRIATSSTGGHRATRGQREAIGGRTVKEYVRRGCELGAGQIYSRSEDFLVLRIFFVALVYVNTYIRPV